MMKRLLLLAVFVFLIQASFAQVQSPDQFLGYKIGTKYTPHHRIVDYYKYIASAVPSMVKLQQYGQTNEGRPLMVAYVSTAENISNLENIRNNNLRLANMADGKGNASSAPPVVWLSYNVHGNETSSSEAALLTIFSLVDPNNAQTKQWLQNTLVIIDPCLNPDGRDRYVNWFNSVVGKNYNAAIMAREHREPWPGGRTNHYNFDLNRDWAWQTQIESQQRLKLYHQWFPQIHVDFHEQGINNPYYFAPAAEPFHEVITPWQRNFQKTIGQNHARYFDEKGWLYFTRERFDLLYPSYGDTYPVYNGSIGMTYEQAGGGAGGLGVHTETGDTLTLVDRATHHFTTSLSTIEIASKNASKLIAEFEKYFADASAGRGSSYQTYVIRNSATDAERVNALVDLLQKNKIQFSSGRQVAARGYNYNSGKEESFTVDNNDILISAAQPKSNLIQVLFEPNTKLADSATYDITAWALPYAYGLKAFATKEKLAGSNYNAAPKASNPELNPYAYVIRWNGMQTVQLVGQLLQKGIKLRYAELPFTANGQSFDRGTVIVMKTGNQFNGNLWSSVRELANQYNVQLTPVSTGFVEKGLDFGSSSVRPLKQRRVALLTGEGVSSNAAGEVWHYFDQQISYPITLVNANDIARINWSDFDVVIMPDGNYRFFNEKSVVDQLKSWINGGGNLVALEGAVAQLSKQDWSIKAKKADETAAKDPYEPLRKYEARERDFIPNTTPGSIFRVELDNTHPLAFGFPNYYYTLKQDDNIYDFIKEGGWNVGVIKKDKQVAGFVGSRLQKKLQDGLLFGVQEMGRGNVIYLTDDVIFRNFWENGKLMLANAVFLVGQ